MTRSVDHVESLILLESLLRLGLGKQLLELLLSELRLSNGAGTNWLRSAERLLLWLLLLLEKLLRLLRLLGSGSKLLLLGNKLLLLLRNKLLLLLRNKPLLLLGSKLLLLLRNKLLLLLGSKLLLLLRNKLLLLLRLKMSGKRINLTILVIISGESL